MIFAITIMKFLPFVIQSNLNEMTCRSVISGIVACLQYNRPSSKPKYSHNSDESNDTCPKEYERK